ncbi:MAG: rbfA [Gammaproteobacteria bacterium]|nr:rbfA [Gammaproteobacteria bacterium]
MPRQFGRNRRVADLVQREMAILLQREMTDPKIGLVTVSAVDISPDLKNARIFVTCLGGQQQTSELVRNLNEMAGHYRHELARVLTLRTVPQIRFEFDVSIQRGRHMSDLIDSLSASAKSRTSQDES